MRSILQTTRRIHINEHQSEEIEIRRGVRQSCVLLPREVAGLKLNTVINRKYRRSSVTGNKNSGVWIRIRTNNEFQNDEIYENLQNSMKQQESDH